MTETDTDTEIGANRGTGTDTNIDSAGDRDQDPRQDRSRPDGDTGTATATSGERDRTRSGGETDLAADFASAATAFFSRRTAVAPQSVLAISILGALVSGYFLQWTLQGLAFSVVAFALFALVSWVAIVRQPTARNAVATVCYTMAGAGVVAPVLFFAELAGQASGATGLEALGSGIGIIAVFPTVSLLHVHVAVGFALAGYAISRTVATNGEGL